MAFATLGISFAEFELVRVTRISTAIAFVVLTGAVVVARVANTVACPVRVRARAAALLDFRCIVFAFGIQTLAVFTELELVLMSGIATAVSLIPSTTTVVVVVVADTIIGPIRRSTLSSAFLVLRIQTLALGAKLVDVLLATAVTAVPIACAVVVFVVASRVTFPVGFPAFAGVFRTFFDLSFAIFALALGTKRCFVDFLIAAAITVVPVAASIVVDIIADSVADVGVAT